MWITIHLYLLGKLHYKNNYTYLKFIYNNFFSGQRALLERFNYLHNVIKIPHAILLKYPNSLLCRSFKVKQRHQFLCQLGRAQYDPQKENYIPIMALVEDTDVEFCNKYAKCNIENFNTFLKTL